MAGLCITVTGNAMVFYALAHVFEIQVFVMAWWKKGTKCGRRRKTLSLRAEGIWNSIWNLSVGFRE
jgi:hypothetical protein